MLFRSNTFVITPAPPLAGFAIAPIRPQTNTDGDEVELEVVIVRSSGPSALSVSSGNASSRHTDDKNEYERRGRFSISGLNGLEIDAGGEISGRIKAGVTAVTVFKVTVAFTLHGVTATQQITWTVKPALPNKGGKR